MLTGLPSIDRWIFGHFTANLHNHFTDIFFSLIVQIQQKKKLFHTNHNKIMAANFCTCHDSCAVVACAKICSNWIVTNRNTTKYFFHRSWILYKISVWWIYGPIGVIRGRKEAADGPIIQHCEVQSEAINYFLFVFDTVPLWGVLGFVFQWKDIFFIQTRYLCFSGNIFFIQMRLLI